MDLVYTTSKDKKFKILVINLMGNVFRKTEDVFLTAEKIIKKR